MTAEHTIALFAGLFLLSFAHEETAIIAGGYLITAQQLGAEAVLAALTSGIILGDWAIYGLGAAASRLPRLERWIKGANLIRPRDWLQRHLLLTIVVARLFPGPGILFPVFSGLGMLRIGFVQFAVLSAIVAAFYTPAMLCLTVLYGDQFVPMIGWLAWPLLLILPALALAGPWARPLRRWALALVGAQPLRPDRSAET